MVFRIYLTGSGYVMGCSIVDFAYEDQSSAAGSTVSSLGPLSESGVVVLVPVLVRGTCVQLGHAHSPSVITPNGGLGRLWSNSSPSPLALSIRHRACRHNRASPLRHCPLDLPRPGSNTHPVDEQASYPDGLRLTVHPEGKEPK